MVREYRPPACLKISVETHRNHPQQQPARARGDDAFRLDPDQPIGLQWLQAVQGIGEVVLEVDAVKPLDRVDRYLALAHQPLDHIRAQLVVRRQPETAPHRKARRIDRVLPRLQLARILAVAVADAADRADAEPDQVAIGVRRITHEIPMQSAARLRQRQLIVGQREMVHADVDITG